MIKKIPVAELRVGMFVHDVNCSWRIEPNFVLRYKVVDDRQIEEIHELGVREVYIDTLLGEDVPGAPDVAQVRRELEEDLQFLSTRGGELPVHHRLASRAELLDALNAHASASDLIRGLMCDVRLGRQIEHDAVTEALQRITETMLASFGTMIQLGQLKTSDEYTFQHSIGVSALLTAFAKALKFNRQTTADVGLGALLHDIGKMRVPAEILNKPGRLTEDEFNQIKCHVEYGCEILGEAPWVTGTAFKVMAQHHERFDGSGYPKKLKGNEIASVGQMAAIVDVYDAITARRVYHEPMMPAEALRKLREWSHFHFNEELVIHFIRSLGIYPLRTVVRLESGRVGIVIDQNPADLLRPVLLIVHDAREDCPLVPRRLDLARDLADRIVTYEAPEKYAIDVDACLCAYELAG